MKGLAMKSFQLLACAVIATFILSTGCSKPAAETKPKEGTAAGPGEHVHDDGTVHKGHDEEGHAHGEGPHGGTVADWGGGKFHVEFTVDRNKKEGTVYVLGGDEKTPSPIDAAEITLAIKDPAFSVALKASPQEGDPEGKASRFVGNHDNLGIVKEYEGSMSGVVDGTPYSGNFKEVPHDH
jgi:hypothetical protein